MAENKGNEEAIVSLEVRNGEGRERGEERGEGVDRGRKEKGMGWEGDEGRTRGRKGGAGGGRKEWTGTRRKECERK